MATGESIAVPTAATGSAKNVTKSPATVTGTINPSGKATTYTFQYGPTMAYGSTAPATPQSAGSGTSSVPVSTTLSGLKANTTYHYRIVAGNGAGASNGTDMTFKTTASTLMLTPSKTIMRQ